MSTVFKEAVIVCSTVFKEAVIVCSTVFKEAVIVCRQNVVHTVVGSEGQVESTDTHRFAVDQVDCCLGACTVLSMLPQPCRTVFFHNVVVAEVFSVVAEVLLLVATIVSVIVASVLLLVATSHSCHSVVSCYHCTSHSCLSVVVSCYQS